MQVEKILKRESGDRVKIQITLVTGRGNNAEYKVVVETCLKGKRTWVPVIDRNCHIYRKTKFASPERNEFSKKLNLAVVTESEINTAKIAMWEILHPSKQFELNTVY